MTLNGVVELARVFSLGETYKTKWNIIKKYV
jgi:hypothetical protein